MAALPIALGKVVVQTPGIPVQVTIPPTINPRSVHALTIATLKSNTGAVYIGTTQAMSRSQFTGVLQVLPIPTANSIPTFSIAVTHAANAIPLDLFWFDADVGGEGVLISVLIA